MRLRTECCAGLIPLGAGNVACGVAHSRAFPDSRAIRLRRYRSRRSDRLNNRDCADSNRSRDCDAKNTPATEQQCRWLRCFEEPSLGEISDCQFHCLCREWLPLLSERLGDLRHRADTIAQVPDGEGRGVQVVVLQKLGIEEHDVARGQGCYRKMVCVPLNRNVALDRHGQMLNVRGDRKKRSALCVASELGLNFGQLYFTAARYTHYGLYVMVCTCESVARRGLEAAPARQDCFDDVARF